MKNITRKCEKKFRYPEGITIRPDDKVVVADFNEKVMIFDKDLNLVSTLGQGNGDSKLNNPVDVAVNRTVVAVSDWNDHVVKLFSLQGDYRTKFGSEGSGDGLFYNPQGLCFNSNGLLYVVDGGNYRVQVFDRDRFVFKFGSRGRNSGQFQNPYNIAVDSGDLVYVTDFSDDGGIIVFSKNGHFIKKIDCNNPYAICIAPYDYIISGIDNVLTVFSPAHQPIIKFNAPCKRLNLIRGIAINNSGTIFVTKDNYYKS